MLNCSDVECILHHDHYYHNLHQLHQLQLHLQDHREHHDSAMSGEADDSSDGLKQNETVLEELSHPDAPNESVYTICGVLIAMLLVGLIIVLLAVTISKLRKRDDSQHSDVHPQDVVLQTTTTTTTTGSNPAAPAVAQTTISTISQGQMVTPEQPGNGVYQPPQFLWQYPARYMYSNDQETLVHSLPAERPGFCRGFRKNLRGRWRRLVKRKPSQEAYTIPAELRDQLKQIYVY